MRAAFSIPIFERDPVAVFNEEDDETDPLKMRMIVITFYSVIAFVVDSYP